MHVPLDCSRGNRRAVEVDGHPALAKIPCSRSEVGGGLIMLKNKLLRSGASKTWAHILEIENDILFISKFLPLDK